MIMKYFYIILSSAGSHTSVAITVCSCCHMYLIYHQSFLANVHWNITKKQTEEVDFKLDNNIVTC